MKALLRFKNAYKPSDSWGSTPGPTAIMVYSGTPLNTESVEPHCTIIICVIRILCYLSGALLKYTNSMQRT